jgi:hypothetical protein
MVKETGLESLTEMANAPAQFIDKIDGLFDLEFSEIEIEKRRSLLESDFSNIKGAQQIQKLLF